MFEYQAANENPHVAIERHINCVKVKLVVVYRQHLSVNNEHTHES
jgi:hypothetical protein